jgi:divalent metal cation (Fe/Co/Zn/Cd) transporter
VDSLTAFVALLMIVGSNFMANAQWMDPIGGLIISLMVIQAGWGNTRAALFELADVGVEEEMKENVQKAATQALASVNTGSANDVQLRSVQGIKSGQNYLMDLELAAPESWSIKQTRGVEDLVRERVGAKVRGVKRVRVRFISKSSEQSDYLDEFIGRDFSATSSPEAEEEHNHDHDHDHAHGHSHKGNGNARRRK